MIELKENMGIPRSIVIAMAVLAGVTVANLYYNQPLLEMISSNLGISHITANLITVITQVGYAFGLFFIIPSGDLYSRRRIISVCMTMAAVMSLIIGLASNIYIIWGASLLLGASSVIPQLFIPVAGQFSRPEDKSKNIGYVLSGLLTGILAARVVSGFIGEWLSWRAMFLIAAGLMIICCGIVAGHEVQLHRYISTADAFRLDNIPHSSEDPVIQCSWWTCLRFYADYMVMHGFPPCRTAVLRRQRHGRDAGTLRYGRSNGSIWHWQIYSEIWNKEVQWMRCSHSNHWLARVLFLRLWLHRSNRGINPS